MVNKHVVEKKNNLTTMEIAAKLRKDFPEIYSNVYCGLSCPTGWFSLVYELSENLQGLISVARKAGVKVEVKVAQVKSKLAGLRYYTDVSCKNKNIVESVRALIYRAEKFSESRCELCGEYGEILNIDGWLVGRCGKHKKMSWSKYETELTKNRKS